MTAEDIFEVVTKLTGKVEPYADSAIDAQRHENMEKFINVFRMMHRVIDDVAYRYGDSPYASAKQIADLANEQLDDMGITE